MPRRAAVVLSAVALTGALAACGDETTDQPEPLTPEVEEQQEDEPEEEPVAP